MCKNWIEIGLCRYGNKCQFAHGENELMGKALPVNNNKYKSKTCTTFNEKLYCPYGQRCLFKHEDRQFDDVKNFFYLHRLVMLQHAFCDPYASKVLQSGPVKRLKIFQMITDQHMIEKNIPAASPFKIIPQGEHLTDKRYFVSSTSSKEKLFLSSPQLSFQQPA